MNAERLSQTYLLPAGVHITMRFASELIRLTNLEQVRRARRGTDPEFDEQATAIRVAALTYQETVGSVRVPYSGSDPVPRRQHGQDLGYTPTQVAETIGVSSRAVVKAIHDGRLQASKIKSRWVVSIEAVNDYRAARRLGRKDDGR